MLRILFGVTLGVILAPAVKRYRRPVLARAVRAGMAVGREARAAALTVREDIEDLAAEAAHETATPGGPTAYRPAS